MITLALLKWLEEKGLGVIDETLFWQKMGLNQKGLYITNVGVSMERGERRNQRYEIFSLGKNNLEGLKKLEEVVELLRKSFSVNELPEVEGVKYDRVAIMPPSSVSTLGENDQGLMVYSISGNIYY